MLVIIGGGAAGLAAGIFARRANPSLPVVVLDGARTPGAKILVSGGTRCNVTNAVVTEHDFNGGRPAIIRHVLRGWTVADTIAFFRDLGVRLHEEPGGKLFPDSGRARDVRDALVAGLAASGGSLRLEHRVHRVSRESQPAAGFVIETSQGLLRATSLVLATGGRSLPKTGSDGAGYSMARALGHSIVPTTPALVPLVLPAAAHPEARELSGIAHPVQFTVRGPTTRTVRIDGPMLWTHFGLSGPATLDVSRHWLAAVAADAQASLAVHLCPAQTFDTIEATWLGRAREHPRATAVSVFDRVLPAAVSAGCLAASGVDPQARLADVTRDARRRVINRLIAWPLTVEGSRGYNYAEVTAGGVPLTEVHPATLESRRCSGLFLAGEILDVDGRLGGFNFQWAWSSAFAAGSAAARRDLVVATA